MAGTMNVETKWLMIGATGGLGSAVARELGRTGADLVLVDVESRSELLRENANDLRQRYEVQVDTASHPDDGELDIRALFKQHKDGGSPITGLFVASGVMWPQTELETDADRADLHHRINFTQPMKAILVAAEHFEREGRGHIAAIGSPAGDRGRRSNYHYGADKAALHTLLEGMRHRFAGGSVRVTTVKPGPTRTPMTAALEKLPLLADPRDQARRIVSGLARHKAVIYTPPIWQWIMLVIRHLPRFVYNRLNL